MRNLTVLFTALLLITFTGSASAQKKNERKPYNKEVAKTFTDVESSVQVYLSSEITLLSVIKDTVVTAKNGKAVTTVNDDIMTITVRNKERGQIIEWRGDTCFVQFSTKDQELTTLPFVPSGSGKNNNLVLMTNTICGYQIDGSPIYCPTNARKITLVDTEGNERTFSFSGDRPKLEYVPQLVKTKAVKKVKSKGVKVK